MDLATKISKTISMPGYILNSDILNKIDEIAISTIQIKNNSELEVFYSVRDNKDNEKLLKNLSDIDPLYENPTGKIVEISLNYEISKQAGLSISFQNKGDVEISGYSQAVDFEYKIDQIIRELNRCEQEYHWLEYYFAISNKLKKFLFKTLSILFLTLVACSLYVLYAKNVGIDITNAGIIPNGNTYYKTVESAINSDDTTLKLNALLMGKLRGFSNVTDVISRISNYIKYISISTIVVFVFFLAIQNISKLYPLTFFEFGDGVSKLQKLKRKREVWGTVVVLGFVINISSGLLLALLI